MTQRASVVAEGLPEPDDPMVVQVSRWDHAEGHGRRHARFRRARRAEVPGWLVLAGPSVEGVADDPEGAIVYCGGLAQWQSLPPAQRSRVILTTFPVTDVDENAAMVNALQRHASVIVQKSLAEGFGLTVAEGMWKGRPVVGSAVGGIQDQIADGTGILLPDPADLPAFGRAVRTLLDDPRTRRPVGRGRPGVRPRPLRRRPAPSPLRRAVRHPAGRRTTGARPRSSEVDRLVTQPRRDAVPKPSTWPVTDRHGRAGNPRRSRSGSSAPLGSAS